MTSTAEIRTRHESDIRSHDRLSQMHKDRGILLDRLDKIGEVVSEHVSDLFSVTSVMENDPDVFANFSGTIEEIKKAANELKAILDES